MASETSGMDEWTEEKCLQMIRAFRDQPVLWDKKHQFYFRQKKKVAAWQEIGKIMNISPELCKHKMGILMSSFRREKSRTVHSVMKEDPSDAYTSNWFAFKDMSFLLDKDRERKRQRTGEPIINVPEPAVIESSSISTTRSAAKEQRLIQCRSRLQHLNNAPQRQPLPSASNESEDEIKAFTNFISSKMKKYSEPTKNAVQQAICEVIFRADQAEHARSDSNTETRAASEDLAIEDESDNDKVKKEMLIDYDDS